MSKKQFVVVLSTTEAEYMAATHASKEAVWLQRLCSSMGLVQEAIRSSKFDMRHLIATHFIFGMDTRRDRAIRKL